MQEQLYNDFVSNVLPKIQEGLVITQEYFTDLFGRYVHYLIISDSLFVILNLVILILTIYCFKKYFASLSRDNDVVLVLYAFSFIISLEVVSLMTFGLDLIKDIYIPEVRVYEELLYYK